MLVPVTVKATELPSLVAYEKGRGAIGVRTRFGREYDTYIVKAHQLGEFVTALYENRNGTRWVRVYAGGENLDILEERTSPVEDTDAALHELVRYAVSHLKSARGSYLMQLAGTLRARLANERGIRPGVAR